MHPAPLAGSDRALSRASRLQRAIHALRTEGDSRGREAGAVGMGLAIGCSPFWGFHFPLCWMAGLVFGLNRLKMYLAANVINPVVIAPLLYVEVQTGSLVRRGHATPLSWGMLNASDIWTFGGDLLVGSAIVGLGLGALGALVTYAARRPAADPFFQGLARRASDRYLDTGITAWEFARGKLSGDPVYAAALAEHLAGATGTLLDIGCGQGLMLALIAEAQDHASRCEWDRTRPDPPQFERIVGIETRRRVAAIATRALEHEAEIVSGDAREVGLPRHDVAMIFDVLHLLPDADQRALLRAVRQALMPGGRLLVREADAAAGWRFRMVRLGNRLTAIVTGHWRRSFTFRTATDWCALLDDEGFAARVQAMGEGTPFANVLISASVRGEAG